MGKPQEPRGQLHDLATGVNLVAHAVEGCATAILPFLRKDFGSAYFGFNALVAVIVMLVYGAAQNADDMLRYLGVWLVFVTCHRLDAARATRLGKAGHSRFSGHSFVAERIAPRAKRRTLQLMVEPAISMVAGVALSPFSPGVGGFLILGSVAVLMSNGMQRARMEQRVRAMRDAQIEQQYTARMFRANRDDEF